MALTRKAKIWILVFTTPLVLVLAAALALKLYFTDERLKAMLIPVLEEGLQRDVTLSAVRLSLFPVLALEADSLVIANSPGFSPRPLLSLGRLELQIRLFSLLGGSVDVSRVLLERPHILVEYNETGAANYQTPGDGDAPPEPAAHGSPLRGGDALLSDIRLEDGRVDYIDRAGNTAMTLAGLSARMKAEVLWAVEQIRVSVSGTVGEFSTGTVETPMITGLRLGIEQNLVYRQRDDSLIFEPGSLTVGDIPLELHGTISQVLGIRRMDLVCGSDSVNIARVLSLVPDAYRAKSEGVQGEGAARIRITISGVLNDSTNPEVRGVISMAGARVQYPGLPRAITGVTVESDFIRTRKFQQFRITRLGARLGNDPVSASMTVTGFDDPAIDLDATIRLDLATVKEYYPLDPATVLSGGLDATLSLAGKISDQAGMKAGGSLTFRDVTIKTAGSTRPMEKLNGSISFTNTMVQSQGLSLIMGGSDLSLRFSLRNYLSLMAETSPSKGKPPQPTATLSLTSNLLRTADLVTEETPRDGQSAGGGSKKSPGFALPGVAMDVDAAIGRLELEKFPLTDVRGNLTIRDGTVTLRTLTCNAFAGRVTTSGTLAAKSPDRTDFDLSLGLAGLDARQVFGTFTSLGRKLGGTLTMNTTLKGGLDDTLGLIPAALGGKGSAKVEEGALEGIRVNQELASALRLPELETVRFKDLAAAFTVADGKIIMQEMTIHSPQTDYTVKGSHGLDGSLDYSLSVKLSNALSARASVPGFAGDAAGIFKDADGRLLLDFTVGGTMDKPSVAIDTRAARQRAEELARRKAGEGVKKVQDALQDLFKKKK